MSEERGKEIINAKYKGQAYAKEIKETKKRDKEGKTVKKNTRKKSEN